MKRISLSQNKFALVDDEDFEFLNKWKWSLFASRDKRYYAFRQVLCSDGKRRSLLMHRLLLGLQCGDSRQIDHVDTDGLNNTKDNLRICSDLENHRNRGLQTNNSSGYKGVSWHKKDKKWRARLSLFKKEIWIGNFDTAKEAASAYNRIALKYHGEFANLNEIR